MGGRTVGRYKGKSILDPSSKEFSHEGRQELPQCIVRVKTECREKRISDSRFNTGLRSAEMSE